MATCFNSQHTYGFRNRVEVPLKRRIWSARRKSRPFNLTGLTALIFALRQVGLKPSVTALSVLR